MQADKQNSQLRSRRKTINFVLFAYKNFIYVTFLQNRRMTSKKIKKEEVDLKVSNILGKKISRRQALSTGAKVGVAAIGGLIIGGLAGYFAKPAAPAATVTKTVTSTAAGAATTVTAPASTVTKTVTVPGTGATATVTETVTVTSTATATATAPPARPITIVDQWGHGPWDSINWDKPYVWPERLNKVEVDTIPDNWIERFPFLETYRPDKKAAVRGYVLPEGWKDAVKGVDKLKFLNYGGMPHDPATAMGLAAFEDLTGIRIEYEEMEELTLWTKTVSIMTAKSPDIDIVHHSAPFLLASVASRGWAMPLDFFWPEDVQALYSSHAKDLAYYNGHWWASGWISTKPFIHFIRKSWLKEATGSEEPPTTWQELKSVAKKIADYLNSKYGPGYAAFAVPGKDHRYMWQVISGPFYSLGGKFLTPEGKINVVSKESKIVHEYFVSLFKDGIIPQEALGWSWTDAPDLFAKGKAGIVYQGTVNAVRFSNPELAPEIQDDWIALPPLSWDQGYPKATVEEASANLSVSPFIPDERKAAALLFLDLYRSYQAQWNELAYEGNETVATALYNRPDVQQRLIAGEARREAIKYSRSEALPPEADSAQKIWWEWVQKAILGEVSVDEALENAQSEIDQLTE